MLKAAILTPLVKRGIENAAKSYEIWTAGSWPDDAGCENLVTIKVAEAIQKEVRKKNGYLTLECSASEIRECAEKLNSGPIPNHIRQRRRADIALWHYNSEVVYAVVEVKRVQSSVAWEGDLKKLTGLLSAYSLRNSGSLHYCVLAAFVSASSWDAIERRIERLKKLLDNKEFSAFRLKLECGPRRSLEPHRRKRAPCFRAVTVSISLR